MTKVEETSGKVTQEQIEENIIGRWMIAERDGQPVTTNDQNWMDWNSKVESY